MERRIELKKVQTPVHRRTQAQKKKRTGGKGDQEKKLRKKKLDVPLAHPLKKNVSRRFE